LEDTHLVQGGLHSWSIIETAHLVFLGIKKAPEQRFDLKALMALLAERQVAPSARD